MTNKQDLRVVMNETALRKLVESAGLHGWALSLAGSTVETNGAN